MGEATFQARVQPWLIACFGEMIAGDREERNYRFLEEALELVQSCGCTASEAHQLVDYVYGRDIGEPDQEVGGVMVTLAALCLANGLDMHDAAERELARIWTKVEVIRAKQAAKPKHSPLPATPKPADPTSVEGERLRPDGAVGRYRAALAPFAAYSAAVVKGLANFPHDPPDTVHCSWGGGAKITYADCYRAAALVANAPDATPDDAAEIMRDGLTRIANYSGGTQYSTTHGMRGIAKDVLAALAIKALNQEHQS
ncbi:MAG TPA: hypothetical protein VF638_14170, partial [Sphingomonas sp.]